MKHSSTTNLAKDEAIISPTDNKQLINMGIEFTNNNVSVDMFIATDQFLVS
jgi:hypothetical protein